MEKKIYRYLEIKELETGKVVKRFDITNMSNRQVDKLEIGLMRNMNLDAYYTFEYESETQLETITNTLPQPQ